MCKSLLEFAVPVLIVLASRSAADTHCAAVIDGVETFLIRQMECFDGVRPAEQPPLVQSFGWDTSLPFPPGELDPPPPCQNRPSALAPLGNMCYRGDIYDQSLAAIWFTERARLDFLNGRDFAENILRAQQLLDAGIFLEDYDPYADGRLRAAYWANNLLNPPGTESSIMAPDAAVGNICYFGIALTRFFDVCERIGHLDCETRKGYLDVAVEKANWILDNCTDASPCGFTGGYGDWAQTPFTWKSTEHNIDAWAFARNLFHLTGDPKWERMAERAQCLVQSMYVDVDEVRGYYRTGTLADGVTPNPSPIPADAQAWTALARWDGLRIDTDERAEKAMRWLLENLADGCESGGLAGHGVKFSDVGKNMQCEVTASSAFALLWLDMEVAEADRLLALLNCVRLSAAPDYDGIEDGIGLVATPCPEGAWTGYGSDAWYYKLLHVASSVWAGLACLYVQEGSIWANPFRP